MDNLPDTKFRFIVEYLSKLGFDEEAARLYFVLVKYGSMTIFQVAKRSLIERTKVYRMLDELVDKGLIEEVVEYNKILLKAADAASIEFLINEEKLKSKALSESFSTFSQTIQSLSQSSHMSNVLFYRGQKGIKQMLWNELRAKGESLCFVYKIYQFAVGDTFFEHWAEEFVQRKLHSREIRTDLFEETYPGQERKVCYDIAGMDIRMISSKILPLIHAMTIYNDVVAIYNWWHDEIFGIEICNRQIADMQKLFFETFWKMGKPFIKCKDFKGKIKIIR